MLFTLPIVLLAGCSTKPGRTSHSTNKRKNTGPRVTAQESNDWQVYTARPIRPLKSLSPFAIKKYINEQDENENDLIDFKSVWEELHVGRDEIGTFDGFTPSYSRWHATTFDASGGKAKRVILKVSAEGGADRRYLIFKRRGSHSSGAEGWLISGCIDVLDNRYEGSPHQKYQRVVSDGENTWLVVRGLGNSGTGVYQIDELWYEISQGPTKVLQYPVYGYFSNDTVCGRIYNSRIISQRQTRGLYTVMIQYSVKYAADSNISKRQAATYVWDWKLRRFVLDERRSQLSAEEIEAVYGGGVIEDEKFVAYYNSEFRQIAKHGSARRKNWLRKALSRMDYTPHKTDLEKMLR